MSKSNFFSPEKETTRYILSQFFGPTLEKASERENGYIYGNRRASS